MKLSGNKIGFALLGIAYLISVFLVARRSAEEVISDRVTLRLSQWQLEGGVRESIDAIIRRYEQLNPRVHVVQIAVPAVRRTCRGLRPRWSAVPWPTHGIFLPTGHGAEFFADYRGGDGANLYET